MESKGILSMYALLREGIGINPLIVIDESFEGRGTSITMSLWHKGQRHYKQVGISPGEEGPTNAYHLDLQIKAHIEYFKEYLKGV